MIISKSLIAAIIAMTFWSSSCASTVKVSNYCDVPSNYAGTRLYLDHPQVLAKLYDKDYDLFVNRITLFTKQNVSLQGDHAYVVGDEEVTRMMIIVLDKHDCIVDKLPLSPSYYKYVLGIGERIVFLDRRNII